MGVVESVDKKVSFHIFIYIGMRVWMVINGPSNNLYFLVCIVTWTV